MRRHIQTFGFFFAGHAHAEEAAYDRNLRGPSPQKALSLGPLLTLGGDAELARCDVVVEAIVESLDAKRELFRRLEPLLPPLG